MIKMILKRIFQLIPVLLITMSMTFVITRVLPGNPAVSILGPQATAEDIAKLEEEMGLHDPMPVQYINYMKWPYLMLERCHLKKRLKTWMIIFIFYLTKIKLSQ